MVATTTDRCPSSLIPIDELTPDWFFCLTPSGQEIKLAEHLAKCGNHFFLPMERVRRKKINGQGREYWFEYDRPRFSRYLFLNGHAAQIETKDRSYKSGAHFSVQRVANASQERLHDELVQLSRAIEVNPYLMTASGYHKGQRIRICRGPMLGVVGTFDRMDERRIVWLNCQILGQATPIEGVSIDWIEPCE